MQSYKKVAWEICLNFVSFLKNNLFIVVQKYVLSQIGTKNTPQILKYRIMLLKF